MQGCERVDEVKIIIGDNKSKLETKRDLNKIKNNSNLNIDLTFFDQNNFYWPAANKIILEKLKKEKTARMDYCM